MSAIRLDGANFVVGVHHRNEDRVRRHRATHVIWIYAAQAIDRQVGDLRPEPFQEPAGVKDR
jgi:hypothetical protein